MCVTANSGVAAQLQRRARQVQPLPFHLAMGATREQHVAMMVEHLTAAAPFEHYGGKLREQLLLINPT
ncbi:MAG: hypothetical protein WDW36_009495 [Sanguina aurantia]